MLFEYGCKYIKDGRNFHILNIEQVGRRLSLAEVERAQLVSGDVGDDGGDDGDGDDDDDAEREELVSWLDLDCNDDHTSG